MSLGVVLDVAIGLALAYMLLGLIASAAQETAAAALSLRGKQLRSGIESLIAGSGPVAAPVEKLFRDVFGHALVQGVAAKGLPSYVPSRNFASALFAVLADGSQAPVFSQIERQVAAMPDCAAKSCLVVFIKEAGGDLDKLKASVETWYDDAMDRLSGVYKRLTHYFALAFGFAVAVVFNVNSVTIAEALWTDPDKRAAIVAVASSYAGQDELPAEAGSLTAQIQAAQAQLDALPIPMGWRVPADRTLLGTIVETVFAADGGGIRVLLGWLATALAVSLGAPFWFDAMKKLVNMRAAGPKPARADRET